MHARFMILAAAAALLATPASAASGPTLRDRQQAACYDDAQRLCGEYVPDVDKVSACMKANRSRVSAKCAKFYKTR